MRVPASVKYAALTSVFVTVVVSGLARVAGAEETAMTEDGTTGAVRLSTENASIKLNLLIQGGLHVFPNATVGNRSSFALERARVGFSGHLVSKNFTYAFVGDGAAGMQSLEPTMPGSEAAVLPGEPSVPFVLDASVRLRIPSIGLLFTFGRFIPSIGLMMGEDPAKLGTALYPLYLIGGKNAMGSFRDIGLEMEIKVGKALFLGGGVYNGGFNAWTDDNDRKDLSAFLTVRPGAAFTLRASSMFKFRNVDGGIDGLDRPLENGVETHITPCVEARFTDLGFDIIGGYAADFTMRDDKDTRQDDRAQGAFGHLGYLFFGDLLSIDGRFDWWDPSVYAADNEQYRITVGPTVYLEAARLSLRVNYIQDIFTSERAMCERYLYRDDCEDVSEMDAAEKFASTLLLQLTLSL